MTPYKLHFIHCHINCNNFKEREAQVFQNIICKSRHANVVRLHSYANISFDPTDNMMEYPIINELSSFTRTKANAMIFEVDNNKYDRILIYQQLLSKGSGFYGFIAYKSEDITQQSHIFNIGYNVNDLMWRINSFLTPNFY